MKIELIRTDFADTFTMGELLVNGQHECFTIEDKVRDNQPKVSGKTAIPYGAYKVVVTMSNRFKRLLPLLIDVPGFEGIRIHPGNTAEDTDGCLLPGTKKGTASVLNSRIAFEQLFAKIQSAIANGEQVDIEIKKGLQHNIVA